MKYFTIALFLGVISTRDIELEEAKAAINALKIKVSKAGQAQIEKEATDVEITAKKIQHSRPVRNIKSALERWAQSKEMAKLQKLDKKFYSSPEGKRLIAEWKDVGRVLENNVYENKTGVHIPNSALNKIGDEMDDVAYEYKKLEGSKWDKAYEATFNDLTTNKEAGAVKRRVQAFKASPQGKALKKELMDLKKAIKQNVKITDVPKDMTSLLKIEVSPAGQKVIEGEANDVEAVWNKVKDTKPFRNMGSSLERWGTSTEVEHLKELDKKFLASPEGKRLVAEWTDFGKALKEAIKETPNGIHIDNDDLQDAGDEFDDVMYEYKKLEKSPWAAAYEQGWKDATHNKEAQALGRRAESFKQSAEWQALEKELKDLDMAIKKNVKVTDIPKETLNMIKVQVTNPHPIEKEWNDVEATWGKIENSAPVRNVGSSLERWGNSAEVEKMKALEDKFLQTPEGKELMQEWSDVFNTLDEAVYHNDKGLYIDNGKVQAVSDELDDVEYEYKKLEKTHWAPEFDQAYGAAFNNKEAQSVGRRFDSFGQSAEGQALSKELDDFGKSLKENVKVTDIPEEWKKDMYLF